MLTRLRLVDLAVSERRVDGVWQRAFHAHLAEEVRRQPDLPGAELFEKSLTINPARSSSVSSGLGRSATRGELSERSCSGLASGWAACLRTSGSLWSGHKCRAGDHEAERDRASDDRGCADPDRVAEHEDAAHDRGEVGGNRGERDHGHAGTELQSASQVVCSGVTGRARRRGVASQAWLSSLTSPLPGLSEGRRAC